MSYFLNNQLLGTAHLLIDIALDEEFTRATKYATTLVANTIKRGNKILILGNGGSCADALHFAAEFVGRFKTERAPLAAIALGSNPAALSAISNDYNYSASFARELMALGKKGDCLIILSTSGKSPNCLEALIRAKQMELATIALTGEHPDILFNEVDIKLSIPSDDTPQIQDCHGILLHIIADGVESIMANKE